MKAWLEGGRMKHHFAAKVFIALLIVTLCCVSVLGKKAFEDKFSRSNSGSVGGSWVEEGAKTFKIKDQKMVDVVKVGHSFSPGNVCEAQVAQIQRHDNFTKTFAKLNFGRLLDYSKLSVLNVSFMLTLNGSPIKSLKDCTNESPSFWYNINSPQFIVAVLNSSAKEHCYYNGTFENPPYTDWEVNWWDCGNGFALQDEPLSIGNFTYDHTLIYLYYLEKSGDPPLYWYHDGNAAEIPNPFSVASVRLGMVFHFNDSTVEYFVDGSSSGAETMSHWSLKPSQLYFLGLRRNGDFKIDNVEIYADGVLVQSSGGGAGFQETPQETPPSQGGPTTFAVAPLTVSASSKMLLAILAALVVLAILLSENRPKRGRK